MAALDLTSAVARESLPAAVVDLDAFDRNLERHVALTAPRKTPIRVATKSVRVRALLRRLLDRGGGAVSGLMCFSAYEAAFLAAHDFDDLLVAYPTLQRAALDALAEQAHAGKTVSIVVDSRESVDALASAGSRAGVTMSAALCVDMSLLLFGRHVGVRRSPLFSAEDVLALARYAKEKDGVRITGVMAYEAIVAGVGDARPHDALKNGVKSWIKKKSVTDVKERRAAIVRALEDDGFELAFVNGGGTGSLESTTPDTGVTEVAAGSGFFKPHLFDCYESPFVRSLEPAAFFALEAARRPAPGFVTCSGGGYVASGEIGVDRAPLPFFPEGLSLLPMEGAGEVQTPLQGSAADTIALGSPVLFRHAKAGEVMERFSEALLVSNGEVVERVPTYRGDAQCFL
jgi:D-serine deaminase-like pyridoxal phosphate-dependent protein